MNLSASNKTEDQAVAARDGRIKPLLLLGILVLVYSYFTNIEHFAGVLSNNSAATYYLNIEENELRFSDTLFIGSNVKGDNGSNNPILFIRIPVNESSSKLLQTIPGVGERLSNGIVKERETNGVFKSYSDLKRVEGIGNKKVQYLKTYLSI